VKKQNENRSKTKGKAKTKTKRNPESEDDSPRAKPERRSQPPDYLRGYSRAQLRVIQSDAAVKQVVAAAGSGKTRTVVGLIEHTLRADRDDRFTRGRRALLLSFSRRAVGELRERLPADLRGRIEVSTFHSFCFRWLSRMRSEARLDRAPLRLITDEEREDFLRRCLAAGDFDTGGIPFAMLFQDPDRFRGLFPEAADRVFRRYRAYKRATGLLEYDDLVQRMLAGLRSAGDGPFSTLRDRYPLIVVDEFQDTDPDQLEFLRLMRPRRLTVVGDDWQAIYAFRGATVGPFLDFRGSFRNVRIFRLAENYRSLRPIVRLGNRLIQASRRQLRKRVRAVRGAGPGLPVLGYALGAGREGALAADLPVEIKNNLRILVRTNYRRRRWIGVGFDPEQVLTIHKAKGLEFPVVCVDLMGGWSAADRGSRAEPGAANLFARFREERPDDEEIRVLYVAASRAENLLVFLRDPEARETSREHWYWHRLCRPSGARDVSGRQLEGWLEREAAARGARD
jgi:DNA helicase-2/ATP-dependent DNA helicase PcrA